MAALATTSIRTLLADNWLRPWMVGREQRPHMRSRGDLPLPHAVRGVASVVVQRVVDEHAAGQSAGLAMADPRRLA